MVGRKVILHNFDNAIAEVTFFQGEGKPLVAAMLDEHGNRQIMTHTELQSLTDSGHDLTAKVAHAIIAAAQVGPSTLEMQVDNVTLGMIARTLGMVTTHTPATPWQAYSVYELRLTFMEVELNLFARVPR